MRRKAAAAPLSPGLSNGPPLSPASTGAMDSLLEKLRAAAPQARDQRDRRRRARLKDRHQVRVASGQKMPDVPGMQAEGEDAEASGNSNAQTGANGLLSPNSVSANGDEGTSGDDGDKDKGGTSEGEDIVDRAAVMLQGLRGDGTGESSDMPGAVGRTDDGSIRMRRRREGMGEERERRRRRRAKQGSSAGLEDVAKEEGADNDSRPGTAHSRPGTGYTEGRDSIAESESTQQSRESEGKDGGDGERTALPSPPPERKGSRDADADQDDEEGDGDVTMTDATMATNGDGSREGKEGDSERPQSPLPTPVTIVSPPSPGTVAAKENGDGDE